MRATRPFLVLVQSVSFVLAWSVDPASTAAGGQRQSTKALDGITLDQRKLFRDGKDEFEQAETAAQGLGPIFNAISCAGCHSTPTVGGSRALNETRAARIADGSYFELPGGSLFQSDAISPNCRESVPASANVIAQRQTTPLFGVGLIEGIPDAQVEAYAAEQGAAHPQQAGRVHYVVDVASGATRVGRFGWKAQQATLLAFSGDAYLNEMGITNRLFPVENAPNGDLSKLAACDSVNDPEDTGNDIDGFTDFMRFLGPPPRDHETAEIRRGRQLFESVGCAVCHRGGFTTVSPFPAITGQTVDAFSDFLLHDVGTGDGIIQGDARGNEFRTPPLWGISESAPYLHDGSAATITQAIGRHRLQGAAALTAFQDLSESDKQALLAFLASI